MPATAAVIYSLLVGTKTNDGVEGNPRPEVEDHFWAESATFETNSSKHSDTTVTDIYMGDLYAQHFKCISISKEDN